MLRIIWSPVRAPQILPHGKRESEETTVIACRFQLKEIGVSKHCRLKLHEVSRELF